MLVYFELEDRDTYFWDVHPVHLPDGASVDDMWEAGDSLCAEFDRRYPDCAPFVFNFAGSKEDTNE